MPVSLVKVLSGALDTWKRAHSWRSVASGITESDQLLPVLLAHGTDQEGVPMEDMQHGGREIKARVRRVLR